MGFLAGNRFSYPFGVLEVANKLPPIEEDSFVKNSFISLIISY